MRSYRWLRELRFDSKSEMPSERRNHMTTASVEYGWTGEKRFLEQDLRSGIQRMPRIWGGPGTYAWCVTREAFPWCRQNQDSS